MQGHQKKSLVSEGYVKNHNHFFAEMVDALNKVNQVWGTILEDLRVAEVERIEQETQPAIPVGARVRSASNRGRTGTVVSTSVSLFVGSSDFYHPEEWVHLDEDELRRHKYPDIRGQWVYEVRMDPTENQAKRGRKGSLSWIDIDHLEVVEQ